MTLNQIEAEEVRRFQPLTDPETGHGGLKIFFFNSL